MRNISILKNISDKYAFYVYEKSILVYSSNYIYDEIISLENKIDDFLQEDMVILKKDDLYGVFNCWTQELIINLEYLSIEMIQHHHNVIFQGLTSNNKYVLIDKYGIKLHEDIDDLIYIGFFNLTNKYLYMIKKIDELIPVINRVGIITVDGQIIIEPSSSYTYTYFNGGEFIVLEKTIVQTIPTYDIYDASGALIYNNVDNYEFLNL